MTVFLFFPVTGSSHTVVLLFRSFIESVLVYCITIIYSHMYSNDKKAIKGSLKELNFMVLN